MLRASPRRIRNLRGRAGNLQNVVAVLVLGDVEALDLAVAERAAITEISRSYGTKASRIADLVASWSQTLRDVVALADDGLALAVVAEAAGLQHRREADPGDAPRAATRPR